MSGTVERASHPHSGKREGWAVADRITAAQSASVLHCATQAILVHLSPPPAAQVHALGMQSGG